MMDWQLDLMRSAIRHILPRYKRGGLESGEHIKGEVDSKEGPWINLVEAIVESVETLPHGPRRNNFEKLISEHYELDSKNRPFRWNDRLRKFVDGSPNNKTGGRMRERLRADRLAAVAHFLTDPDNPASPLSLNDLDPPAVDAAAPYYVSQFVWSGISTEPLIHPEMFAGRFVATRNEKRAQRITELIFEHTTDAHQLNVAFIDTLYEATLDYPERDGDPLNQYLDRNELISRDILVGWAVLTSQDILLAVLREKRTKHHSVLLNLELNYDEIEEGTIETLRSLINESPNHITLGQSEDLISSNCINEFKREHFY